MHKHHDKKAPTLSAAEAAEGRGASFTGAARRTTSGSMQSVSPGQVRASSVVMRISHRPPTGPIRSPRVGSEMARV